MNMFIFMTEPQVLLSKGQKASPGECRGGKLVCRHGRVREILLKEQKASPVISRITQNIVNFRPYVTYIVLYVAFVKKLDRKN